MLNKSKKLQKRQVLIGASRMEETGGNLQGLHRLDWQGKTEPFLGFASSGTYSKTGVVQVLMFQRWLQRDRILKNQCLDLKYQQSVYRASQMDQVVKNPPTDAENVKDSGLIPGSERSLGERHEEFWLWLWLIMCYTLQIVSVSFIMNCSYKFSLHFNGWFTDVYKMKGHFNIWK